MEVNLQYTTEFETACDLLYWKPEEVLQAFIDQISQAKFYSKRKKGREDYATAFILEMSQLNGKRLLPAKKIQEKYFEKWRTKIKQMDDEPNDAKRYKLYSTFFAEWRKEMIMNMSEQDFVIDVIQRKKELGIDQMR